MRAKIIRLGLLLIVAHGFVDAQATEPEEK
jgi:hypothetical protein